MTQPVIITVAITGAVPRKKDSPAIPVTPAEQVESTHEAFEAGASLVHIHVRNPDESPGSAPELYAQVQEGVRKHCPGMIVQFSTGGRGREQAKRGAMLYLKPDMASLATGSVNFPVGIYENPPDFVEGLARTMLENGIKPEIEVFDLSMLYNAANLVKKGLVKERPHVQFVMGVPNAMPARRSVFDFLRAEIEDVLPGATWVAAGISGRSTSGASKAAGIAARDSRITSASRPTVSQQATPSWCRRSSMPAPNMTGGRRALPKPDSCSVLRRSIDAR